MKESQHTEWKRNWRDEYLRWICGFANAEGGVLVIGLILTYRANPQHMITALGEGRAKPVLEEKVGETRVEMPVVTVETPEVTVETPEVTVETRDRIIELLRAHPHLTLGEVAAQIGKSVSTVERASAKLTREGRLRCVGPRKGGLWEVLK